MSYKPISEKIPLKIIDNNRVTIPKTLMEKRKLKKGQIITGQFFIEEE